MQIRKAIELLKYIQDSHDTVGDLIIYTGNHSIGYLLSQALEFGFLEQYEEGRKKPLQTHRKG